MNGIWRLGRSIAGFGIVGLVVAGFCQLPTSNSQNIDRAISPRGRYASALPLLPPIASSDLTLAQPTLLTTARAADPKEPAVKINSARSDLRAAQIAVSHSQAHLAQARMNLSEFKAKHDTAKILAARGKISRQHIDTARSAYQLAQLQHSSAEVGLQTSTAQLIAAKAKVSRLGCKANAVAQM